MTWSPAQYTKFEQDRTRPVRDLVAAIPTKNLDTAIDLGCGPGNSTEILRARYPDAHITGLDSDPAMIQAARQRLPQIPFQLADLATWQGTADLILSNAVLQWLPDHTILLPRLIHRLTQGGLLAIQMPDNLDEPAYRAMRETAGPDLVRRAEGQRSIMETATTYYAALKPLCSAVEIWRTTYFHVLENSDAIVEWFRGSGLRPYLATLDDTGKQDFLTRYRDAIAAAYPPNPDGTVLLPFPRLFLVATRS
jgi:trans-aconitate 2-methyltransferase